MGDYGVSAGVGSNPAHTPEDGRFLFTKWYSSIKRAKNKTQLLQLYTVCWWLDAIPPHLNTEAHFWPTFEHGMDKLNSEKSYCQKWDSNPRLQSRLRPERSALDRSAILTIEICVVKVSWALWPVWTNVPFKTLFSSFLRRVTYTPRSIVFQCKFLLFWECTYKFSVWIVFGDKKTFVRCGIRTHALIRGPEHSFRAMYF